MEATGITDSVLITFNTYLTAFKQPTINIYATDTNDLVVSTADRVIAVSQEQDPINNLLGRID